MVKSPTLNNSFQYIALLAGLWPLAGCATNPAGKSAVRPPPPVKQTFVKMFPTVKAAEWKIKSDRNYEAEFMLDNSEIAAKFDPAGNWLETESAIPLSKVPQPVQDTVIRQFKDYQVIETQSVKRLNEKELIYELHLDNGKAIVKAQFSADVVILNQSSKPKA